MAVNIHMDYNGIGHLLNYFICPALYHGSKLRYLILLYFGRFGGFHRIFGGLNVWNVFSNEDNYGPEVVVKPQVSIKSQS